MKRISSLDYLRGLAAFSVMVFHYSMWTFGNFNSADFLGRIGLYSVSVFYVLSGITLYEVYYDKIGGPSLKGLEDYAIKRFFRIFPLLWLLSILTMLIKNEVFSSEAILLNFSGLFSIYHWKDTICYGAWSIANEILFYAFFPIFIFLSKRSKIVFFLFSGLLVLIFLWFAFRRLDSKVELGDYWVNGTNPWADYTNPLNQVIFFLGGFLAGYLSKNVAFSKKTGAAIIAVGLLVFKFYPVQGDSMHLITGFNRVSFTLLSFIICYACYKTDFGLSGRVHRSLQTLGEISYSLYMVHPLVWYVLANNFKKHFFVLPPFARILTGFSLSLIIAVLLYRLFEKYFMKLGKRI